MVLEINKKEIIDDLELDIIFKLVCRNKEPKCVNNIYGQFINVGKINVLEKLGILDSETAKKYVDMAKGKFSGDILKMYDSKDPEEELDSLISLYDSLNNN